MRLECERCRAAFSVDDARIPAAGARAACPKCGLVVGVRRPDAPGEAPVDPFAMLPTREPTPGPGFNPFELLPPATGEHAAPPDPLAPAFGDDEGPSRRSQPLPPDPLERGASSTGEFALPEPVSNQTRITGQQALPPDALERDSHTTGEFAVPDAAAAAMSSAAGRVTGQYPVPANLPAIAGAPGAGATVGSPAGALPPAPPPSPGSPGEASPFPDDLFEDAARTTGLKPGVVTGALGRLAAQGAQWRVRKQEGLVEGPYSGPELTERWDAGLVQPTDLVSRDGGPFQGLGAHPLTAAFLSERAGRRVKAFASSERGPVPWRPMLAVLAVVLGGVFGAVLFSMRPALVFGQQRPPGDTSALAIIDAWRHREGVPGASEAELFKLAKGYQASDSPEGRERAVEAYRRVLIEDPKNLDAMARFAEVATPGALQGGDEVAGREAAELLAYALRHGQNLAEPHAARADFLTRTGSAGDLVVAQNEAQTALGLDAKNPSALLAWSRAFVRTNAELALDKAREARKLAPDDRRALLVESSALLALGRIAEARSVLDERSRLIPDDPAAMMELVRLDASVGRFDDARARLGEAEKRAPKSMELAILHAELAYEIDGDLEAARGELEAALAKPTDRAHKLRLLVHAAAVAEEEGHVGRAEALATQGLQLDADDAPLRFRLALVRLAQGKAAEAADLIDKVGPLMPDQTQRALVAARIDAALGKVDLAQAELGKATVLTPLRPDGYLFAAALYAQVGASEQALALAHRALQADPGWTRSHLVLTEFHEKPGGAFDGVIGGLSTLALAGDDEGLTLAALAMARYQAGDAAGAAKAAHEALATGEGALAAHATLAELALDRKDGETALAEARAALEADRSSTLANYLAGRALALLGRWEEAHAKFRDTLAEDPNYLPALARDAEALANLGRHDAALEELQQAYRYDPDDLDTRRELDALGDPGGVRQASAPAK